MIRKQFEQLGLPASVASAGFLEDDREADMTMVRLAANRGVVVEGHLSRVANAELIESSDLVVTMERRHARNLVILAPDIAYRVHTMLGLVQIGSAVPPVDGDLDAFLRAVHDARDPGALIGDLGGDEIADPHGRAKRHYRRCLDQLVDTTDNVVRLIAPYVRP